MTFQVVTADCYSYGLTSRCAGFLHPTMISEVGAALGKLLDVLDGDTVFVEVGAALSKLVDALDEHRVCLVVGAETRSACIDPVH